MSELSERFKKAVEFVKKNGYATSNAGIARRLGITSSAISMAVNGEREPSWELLLDFCDLYPVNFWWLRNGTGSIVKGDDEIRLLQRIEELEKTIEKLRE